MHPRLPPGYRIDRDSDLVVLRRPDGSMAAAFSAGSATIEAVEDAAHEDHREAPLGELASIENRGA